MSRGDNHWELHAYYRGAHAIPPERIGRSSQKHSKWMLQDRPGAWLRIAAQLSLFYWRESLSSVLNSGGATNLAMRLTGGGPNCQGGAGPLSRPLRFRNSQGRRGTHFLPCGPEYAARTWKLRSPQCR